MTQEPSITVQFDFNALHKGYSVRIGQILERAAFALTSMGAAMTNTGLVPDVGVSAFAIKFDPRPVEEVRPETSAWMVGCALRDCIEETALFLERTREVCAAISLIDRNSMPAKEFYDVVKKPADGFDSLPFHRKVSTLRETYGTILDDRIDLIITLNRARNCLVHRLGIVGDKDLKGAGELVVQWMAMQLWVRPSGGEPEFMVTEENRVVKAGREVLARHTLVKRRFTLGQRIALSTADLCNIWLTLDWFSVRTSLLVLEYAKSKGLVVADEKLEASTQAAP